MVDCISVASSALLTPALARTSPSESGGCRATPTTTVELLLLAEAVAFCEPQAALLLLLTCCSWRLRGVQELVSRRPLLASEAVRLFCSTLLALPLLLLARSLLKLEASGDVYCRAD